MAHLIFGHDGAGDELVLGLLLIHLLHFLPLSLLTRICYIENCCLLARILQVLRHTSGCVGQYCEGTRYIQQNQMSIHNCTK